MGLINFDGIILKKGSYQEAPSACHLKITTSGVLKLYINDNESYHTIDRMHEQNPIFKTKQKTIRMPIMCHQLQF